MNRCERNPHAKPHAAAARDRLLERRERLARITGAPAPSSTDLDALAPALEAAARLSARLGADLERVAEASRQMAAAYSVSYREAVARMAEGLSAIDRSPRAQALVDEVRRRDLELLRKVSR